MSEPISQDEWKIIERAFERDPEIQDFHGNLPSRTVYAAKAAKPQISGKIINGKLINDNISAFWDPPTAGVTFQPWDGDNNWLFRFTSAPQNYFSISWTLETHQIDLLDETLLLSISIDQITNLTGKPLARQTWGRFCYVKGSDNIIFSNEVAEYEGRLIFGVSLDDAKFQSSQANRIWIDFIIPQPRSKSIILKNPMLLMQKRINLI